MKELFFWAPLKIGFRRLFASGQIPIGKIFGGYLQVATLKSSCIGLFVHALKIHLIEILEMPFCFFSRHFGKMTGKRIFFLFFFRFRLSFFKIGVMFTVWVFAIRQERSHITLEFAVKTRSRPEKTRPETTAALRIELGI